MKNTIRFSKLFLPAVIFSSALMLVALGGWIFRGFNMGIDFQAGLNETVRLAPAALNVTYSGEGNAQLKVSDKALTLIVSSTVDQDRTVEFRYSEYPSLGVLAEALGKEKGLSVELKDKAETPSQAIVPKEQGSDLIGSAPYYIHRKILSDAEGFASIEAIRGIADQIGQAAVQVVGDKLQQSYMIRIEDKGVDESFSKEITQRLEGKLKAEYGEDRVILVRTDFVGARFSADLARSVIAVVIVALLAILAYAAIRFKPQYAIGAVLAIIHDAMVMVAFMIWTRMEFNTTSIAAILTILGYSINDTIVIFDRIRENRRLRPEENYKNILDQSLTETLSRTIITTLTTLICVIILAVATTGSMRDFAVALIVGMISGTYSTIYIASAFVNFWQNMEEKRKAKAEHRPLHDQKKPKLAKA